METKELIKQAQAENLVAFESGVTQNVLSRLQTRIEEYTQEITTQVTNYFKYKEEE